jgi:bifunctional NMN adenylyltransferase/nudix hydrolase
MQKRFDVAVFVGRFQPCHNGHLEVIQRALELAERVIVLVGSSNQPRTIKNPFTFQERKSMILSYLPETESVYVLPLRDFKSDDNVWASNVQKMVDKTISSFGWTDKPQRIALIGHEKDDTSFYLKLFPQWERVDHYLNEEVNATDIRNLYFTSNIKYLNAVVPPTVYAYLEQFKKNGEYQALLEEYDFIKAYKESWKAAPYAPTFLTVDCVLVQSGHILLIQRRSAPGKGLWALPGGFVNQGERLEAAMLRELKEETRLKVPVPVLKGNIKGSKVFDAPDRSLRGRTVTQAFYIELPAGELPIVKGSDDALHARFTPLSHVREIDMFEDHYTIIQSFLGAFS